MKKIKCTKKQLKRMKSIFGKDWYSLRNEIMKIIEKNKLDLDKVVFVTHNEKTFRIIKLPKKETLVVVPKIRLKKW
jgi:hypothetical protein